MTTKITATAANAALNAIKALIDAGSAGGKILLYTNDVARPSSPSDTATSTLVSTLTCSTTCAGDASGAVLTFSAITSDSSVAATKTVTWGRITDSDDAAVIDFDVTATGGGGDVTFDSVSFITGGTAAITALTLTCATSE